MFKVACALFPHTVLSYQNAAGRPLYPAAQWRAQGFEWRSRCARGVLGDHALVTPPLVITSEQVAELVGLSTAR